jgi:L-rhamnose-H+ transport protein
VVLLGGFVVNGGLCMFLNLKNHTAGDYVKSSTPLLANLFFAGLAGFLWCCQFNLPMAGSPALGKMGYVRRGELMDTSIAMRTLLGIRLGVWEDTSGRTRTLLAIGLLLLVASSVISGYAGSLKPPA